MKSEATTNYQLPTTQSPLVVIVGPTASGKSALALELARKYRGEIICADSRTVYKGMDIGTAKPSLKDQAEIPHHIIDTITPDKHFTAAEFKRRALIWIDDISIRGRLPIMVGGTGLYVDGVIFDYAFLPPSSQEDREHLSKLSIEQLQQKIKDQGLRMPENSKNPRHLIRVLETNGEIAVKKGLRENTLVIGLDVSKEQLTKSIGTRVSQMIDSGLEAEVLALVEKYGWDSPGLQAVGYREWRDYNSKDDVIRAIELNTVRYAKRQRTWFKRNPNITWIKNVAEADEAVQKFLHLQV